MTQAAFSGWFTVNDEEMNKTMPCPVCGGSIGTWTLMIAPTPTRYRCTKCKQRLQLQGNKWILKVIGVLYGAIIVGPISGVTFIVTDKCLGLGPALILVIIAFISLTAVCELFMSIYVLKYRELEKIEQGGAGS